MATPPRGEEPQNADDPQRNKFSFMYDEEGNYNEMQALQALQKATYDNTQQEDIIDRTIRETIEESQTRSIASDDRHGHLLREQHDEPSELFVPVDDEDSDVSTAPQNEPEVREEPDSDDDLMIIDVQDASEEARNEWSKSREPWTVDLTDVKQEPVDESFDIAYVKKEPVDESLDIRHAQASATGSSPEGGTPPVGIKSQNEALDNRRAELAAKLLSGTLSQEDIAELAQITAQLQAGDEHVSASTLTPTTSEKKKRKAPAKTAAEYFAREQEKEDESEKKRQERSSKRGSTGKTSQSSKRQKLSARQKRQLEQGAQRLQSMRGLTDAIQERAEQGELPEEPVIQATRKNDQLRQMAEAAPEGTDTELLRDQMRELRRATQVWGESGCLPRDSKWKIRGMRSLLPNHQIVVGAWMLGRELKQIRDLPRGGILADAMGMGKTIETLSCIVGNQAPDHIKEAGKGATLIVCQSGQMIEQWKSEIKKHCEDKEFSANIVYYKAGNNMDLDLLATFNIVLASYNQVRDGIPSTKVRQQMLEQIKDPEKYYEWLEAETGDLFQIEWLRVVLDEAHMIKNFKTHSSFSCCELKAKYRWAVSGTPLVNDSLELFSYLKFLKFNIGDIGDYVRECVQADDADQKQKQLAYDLMYRRTHSDEFLGKRILNLKPTHPTHQYLKLSKEETVVFRMMERCFRRQLNQDLAAGIAERQILCYLVMLLRLRQASTHPFLLEGVMGEYFTLKDLEITKQRLGELKGQQTIYEQIGTWEKRHEMSGDRMLAVIAEAERRRTEGTTESLLKDVLSQSMKDAASDERQNQRYQTPDSEAGAVIVEDDHDDVDSVDDVLEDSNGMVPGEYLPGFRADQHENDQQSSEKDEQYLKPFGLNDFGSYFDMDRQLDYLTRLETLEIAKCIVCNKRPVDAVQGKGKCEHIFCSRCLVKHFAKKGRNCPYRRCRKIIGEPFRLQGYGEEDSDCDSDVEDHSPGKRKGRKEKEYMKGFDYGGFQPYEDDKKGKKPLRFLQISDRKYDIPVTPSAKTVALKETILRWQLQAPDDKIIIFSQFNVCMKIVARMLEAEGIDFAYLSGSMTTDQRKKAVEEFEKGQTVKVLIASLRAGGTALNLTRGNRVVLMELWWNHAVEQQAFARVFRMGQTKETHFLRFIVNTDIEQRMLDMQVDKILAIDAALQDGGPRAPKLSVEDIASLLGKVVRDETGKMIRVVADYSDEDDDDEDDNEHHSATAAAARLDEEPDLEGFVVPDDELEYEDDEV
ncbi:snf2 family [Colletotrichum kahawae]|uniref:Snf2 family n=1 Tax=Colletotrichum kahawae TaxID=34407 RepID=A0AAE0D8H8_COLKA|nr:snf2 family [Colletotrichum kahawae]